MILIDSNIIIESTQDEDTWVRKLLRDNECYVSMITLIETLGYHNLTKAKKDYFYILFFTNTSTSCHSRDYLQSHRAPSKKKIRTRRCPS